MGCESDFSGLKTQAEKRQFFEKHRKAIYCSLLNGIGQFCNEKDIEEGILLEALGFESQDQFFEFVKERFVTGLDFERLKDKNVTLFLRTAFWCAQRVGKGRILLIVRRVLERHKAALKPALERVYTESSDENSNFAKVRDVAGKTLHELLQTSCRSMITYFLKGLNRRGGLKRLLNHLPDKFPRKAITDSIKKSAQSQYKSLATWRFLCLLQSPGGIEERKECPWEARFAYFESCDDSPPYRNGHKDLLPEIQKESSFQVFNQSRKTGARVLLQSVRSVFEETNRSNTDLCEIRFLLGKTLNRKCLGKSINKVLQVENQPKI